MATMFDAASPPATFRKGERWGGYLNSPTAAAPWGTARLQSVIDAGAMLLPIWVAPLTIAGFRDRPAPADAHTAITQVRELRADRLVVCVDLEERAFEAAPSAAISYIHSFGVAVDNAGGIPVFYSSKYALGAFRKIHPTAAGRPWLALYTADHSSWPVPGWGRPRAWQYSDAGQIRGHRVDLTEIDDGFPLMAAVRTAPLSRRHRWMVRRLTHAFTARHVGFPPADGALVDGLLAAGERVAKLPR